MISNSDTKGASTVKKIDDFNAADRIGVRLLEKSIFFLTGEITEENISECIKWIVYENLDTKVARNLTLYINSEGGDLYQAFALIDIMKTSYHPIQTIGLGLAMSAGFLILASGTPGYRCITQNTSLMCHQFTDTAEGKYHDIKATMKENEMCNQKMVEILKEATGLTASVVKRKLLPASDVYLDPQEAIELGVIDKIL